MRSVGADQAAEAGRNRDHGDSGGELERARRGSAAMQRRTRDDRPLRPHRPDLLRQTVYVTLEFGACRATPNVRAQQRLFDL